MNKQKNQPPNPQKTKTKIKNKKQNSKPTSNKKANKTFFHASEDTILNVVYLLAGVSPAISKNQI